MQLMPEFLPSHQAKAAPTSTLRYITYVSSTGVNSLTVIDIPAVHFTLQRSYDLTVTLSMLQTNSSFLPALSAPV